MKSFAWARARYPSAAAPQLQQNILNERRGGGARLCRILAVLLVPLLMAQSRPASKPVLVPDVSQRDIEIAYSFTGAELLLFG
ncbi:MAG: hypothetical protein ABI240_03375, partial [Sphingomonas sp.]